MFDWEALRNELLNPSNERDTPLDEDTVQTVLLKLLEHQAKGVVIIDPLHFCRRAAKRVKIDEGRTRDVERAALQTLKDFNIPCDTRSGTEQATERKRRERRRKEAA